MPMTYHIAGLLPAPLRFSPTTFSIVTLRTCTSPELPHLLGQLSYVWKTRFSVRLTVITRTKFSGDQSTQRVFNLFVKKEINSYGVAALTRAGEQGKTRTPLKIGPRWDLPTLLWYKYTICGCWITMSTNSKATKLFRLIDTVKINVAQPVLLYSL